MTESILADAVEPGVWVVRLNRPEARNAMTTPMAARFCEVLSALDADPDCRVVVLTGEGAAFCAGLDLKACVFGDEAPRDAIGFMALQETFAGAVARIRRARKPVIAAVRGAAVGAGFGVALAADIRLVSPSAMFLVGAVKIGLSAGECGISYHLPRLIGAGRAFEIMLTGRAVTAEEALACGLVSKLVPEDALLSEALAMARAIAANSPYASKHTKQVMWANLDAQSLEAALELENHVQVAALTTADFREGARAFAEKRPPKFKGA